MSHTVVAVSAELDSIISRRPTKMNHSYFVRWIISRHLLLSCFPLTPQFRATLGWSEGNEPVARVPNWKRQQGWNGATGLWTRSKTTKRFSDIVFVLFPRTSMQYGGKVFGEDFFLGGRSFDGGPFLFAYRLLLLLLRRICVALLCWLDGYYNDEEKQGGKKTDARFSIGLAFIFVHLVSRQP